MDEMPDFKARYARSMLVAVEAVKQVHDRGPEAVWDLAESLTEYPAGAAEFYMAFLNMSRQFLKVIDASKELIDELEPDAGLGMTGSDALAIVERHAHRELDRD